MASRAWPSGHDEQCQEDDIRDSDVRSSLRSAESCYRGIDQPRKITQQSRGYKFDELIDSTSPKGVNRSNELHSSIFPRHSILPRRPL